MVLIVNPKLPMKNIISPHRFQGEFRQKQENFSFHPRVPAPCTTCSTGAMDLRCLHLNGTNGTLCSPNLFHYSIHKNLWIQRPNLCKLGKSHVARGFITRGFSFPYPSFSAIPTRRRMNMRGHSSSLGNSDKSIPPEDGPEGNNTDSDDIQFNNANANMSCPPIDWRTVRANLVAREQVQLLDTESPVQDASFSQSGIQPGQKWAHPITLPETGCVLVATEKLDGTRIFERTVILLLRSGSKDPRQGPFGVVINRPLHKKIRDMKSSNSDLTTTFADCSVHFGGPLDAIMFLLTSSENLPFSTIEEVIPGLCFGARNCLEEAAELVRKGVIRAQDFRFFTGYSGWQFDQLRDEIESNYWFVAACSADLITGSPDSLSGLWEEILGLMGGQYSELGRRPKQDNP